MSKNYTIKPLQSNPFTRHPQITHIWPEPFNSTMVEAVTEDLIIQKNYPQIDIGNIFLIYKDKEVIGITGYFVMDDSESRNVYNPDTQTIYLRWHGIIESQRGKGISEQILLQVLENAKKRYPKLESLIELVPQCDYGLPLEKHFKQLGFKPDGKVENYDWSEYCWQPYKLNVIEFLNFKQRDNNMELNTPRNLDCEINILVRRETEHFLLKIGDYNFTAEDAFKTIFKRLMQELDYISTEQQLNTFTAEKNNEFLFKIFHEHNNLDRAFSSVLKDSIEQIIKDEYILSDRIYDINAQFDTKKKKSHTI